jgi:exopolyphosphatase/guanosine-5'-triphosphate,3'-diphosphate pyrophosphatase
MPATDSESLNSAPVRTVRPVAVIDIGTSSIRMAIAEIDSHGGVRTLETLSQAVSLGKDTFTGGAITKGTIEDCVRVLTSYKRVLVEYQIVNAEQIRVVATSAVREARNRLAFNDRVYVATGLEVEPLDEAEVNRITYLGVQPFLQAQPALSIAKTIVLEVGGGSTELLVVRNNNVLFSHSYRLGSLRLRETLEAYHTPAGQVREIMASQIDRVVRQVREDLSPNGQVEMVALGGDIRFAASQLLPDWDRSTLALVPLIELENFTNEILKLSEDEIVHKHHISFPDADTLGPALLTYITMARSFGLINVMVSNANLRDGLLKEMATKSSWSEEFANQIIRSALDLGNRFDFDEPHARHVAELSKRLFDELRDEHKLDRQHEVILYLAALLHEIGLYVSYQSHHKHAMYLIRHSELFGLGRKSVLLTALVARYYRRASPQPGHEGYSSLDRDDRVTVAKLAAILRVAVALDESRSQRIKELRCRRERSRLIIEVPDVDDLSIEQLALRQSGTLFEDIFGLQVLLRTESRPG